MSHEEAICMSCQTLFSGKSKTKVFQSVVWIFLLSRLSIVVLAKSEGTGLIFDCHTPFRWGLTKVILKINTNVIWDASHKNVQGSMLFFAASVAHSDAHQTYDQEVAESVPAWQVRQHPFIEIDHEIFSIVILFRTPIPEGQLSVSGERMHKYWLNAWSTKPA